MRRIVLLLMAVVVLGLMIFGMTKLYSYIKQRQSTRESANLFDTMTNSKRVIYVKLNTIYIPIIENNHVQSNRRFDIVLETFTGDSYYDTIKKQVAIQSLFFETLSAYATRSPPNNIDNLEFMRGELLRLVDEKFGKGLVNNLLFTVAEIQGQPE